MEGKTLGDYKLIKKLANNFEKENSCFLAEQKFTKKPFVIKIIPSEFYRTPLFKERLEKEIATLTSLKHPHIVKVHGVSFAEEHYFLVMDAILDDDAQATSLWQYLQSKKRRLPEEEAFQILSHVASVLDYIHAKENGSKNGSLIHGSLKLNNVLMGKGNTPFVSDIGFANIFGEETMLKSKFARFSLTPYFLQNFWFLAPEQKKLEHASVLSDTFAFGVLAYYVIGKHFPEGALEPVKHFAPEYQYQWDMLFKECLQYQQEKRRKELLPLLEEIKGSLKPKPRPMEETGREVPKIDAHLLTIPEPQLVEVAAHTNPIHQMLNREPIVTEYQPERKEKKDIKPILTNMIAIPGGQYFRGSNQGNRDESPRHQVYVNDFSLDIHPVTNEQFILFLEYMGGEKDAEYHDLIRLKDSRINRAAGKLSIEPGYEKHPVVGVTWYGAAGYATWVGKRLPTEAEWEIAAAGTSVGPFPTGENIEKHEANFFSSETTPVMSYPTQSFGLYDMVGNVYEWCHDWYSYNYYETSAIEPNNPKGPMQGVYRVLRGGCWKSLKDDLRISHRHRNNPGTVNGTYGFRCACNN